MINAHQIAALAIKHGITRETPLVAIARVAHYIHAGLLPMDEHALRLAKAGDWPYAWSVAFDPIAADHLERARMIEKLPDPEPTSAKDGTPPTGEPEALVTATPPSTDTTSVVRPARVLSGIPYETYAELPGVRSTQLKRIHTSSPLAAHYAERHPTMSAALSLGSALHSAVLEPDTFNDSYVVFEGKTRRGKAWEAFKADNEGKTILTVAENVKVWAMVSAVTAHPIAGPLLDANGKNELSVTWTHSSGVACKCRIDRIGPSAMLELKTTRSIQPRLFATQSAQLGYDLQLAYYSDGCRAAGIVHRAVKVIAVENSPPYDVAVFAVGEDVLEAGRIKYETALETWARCTESGIWPGVAADVELDYYLPAWAQIGEGIDDLDLDWETPA